MTVGTNLNLHPCGIWDYSESLGHSRSSTPSSTLAPLMIGLRTNRVTRSIEVKTPSSLRTLAWRHFEWYSIIVRSSTPSSTMDPHMMYTLEIDLGIWITWSQGCDRTVQFIQDQVRMSPLTRWHTHTFTYINPVVRRVSRKTSVNQLHNQDRMIKQIHITYMEL
jgi:hypothetical protein